MARPIDKSLSDRDTVRARTNDPTVHRMFDFLTSAAAHNGWRIVYYKAAHAAVQFHWGKGNTSYRHSFILNVSDLLFYLRPQALETHPLWSEVALKVFGSEVVKIDANARNETTIRLRNFHDAELVEQVFLRPLLSA